MFMMDIMWHRDYDVVIWGILTCGSFIWCHDMSLMFINWCYNLWGYYNVKHVVIVYIFYNMHKHAILYCSKMVIYNDVMLSWWHARVGILFIFYDVMIITHPLDVCWDVVIDRKSTNESRGLVYLMISQEPIPARENM